MRVHVDLSVASVADHLRERGLIGSGPVDVAALGGGVSCIVVAVRGDDGAFVVKQARPKLDVADDWPAKRERTLTEAAALAFAGDVAGGAVPAVLDIDEQRCILVIEHAPIGWRDWKADLLEGRVDPVTAHRVGVVLGAWHEASSDPEVGARFDDPEAFEQLRVDPYLRTVMVRVPALAEPISGYVERMLSTRRCLVHGDLSPKNVLVESSGAGLWVIDWEVAHLGDPAFDIAFVLNHLMLKSIHRPVAFDRYRDAATELLRGYTSTSTIPDVAYVIGMTGCLMVARVHGKSPAEYLSSDEAVIAAEIGSNLLRHPPASFAEMWDAVS